MTIAPSQPVTLLGRLAVDDAHAKAMAEGFFVTLGCELIDRRSWKRQAEARTGLFAWIEGWYNPRRLHSVT